MAHMGLSENEVPKKVHGPSCFLILWWLFGMRRILQERILYVLYIHDMNLLPRKQKSHTQKLRESIHERGCKNSNRASSAKAILGVEETHEMAFNTDHLAGIPLLLTNAKARHINLVVYRHCMYPIQSRCIHIFVG